MANVEWSIKGPHFINCNCDSGCPYAYWFATDFGWLKSESIDRWR